MGTIYTAETLITADEGGTYIESFSNAGILVEGSQIVARAPLGDLVGESHDVRDFGPGSTILPGLIDTHVHLALDGSPNPLATFNTSDDRELLACMLRNARELLSAGVTTARDLGAPNLLDQATKRAIDSGLARGPRLLTVTAPLTITGGHCWFFGGECEGVEEVRRKVRAARRDGADCIKIMSTGGDLTPGTMPSQPQFTLEELLAIVEEAHRYGLMVTAHAHGEEGIRRAIEAGVDSLEHFSFRMADGSRQERPELIQLAASRGVFICPTLNIAWFTVMDGTEFVPLDMLRRFMDSGLRVVAGTDAGIGNAGHLEYVAGLEGMAALGMTNDEVLLAATALAANSLGLKDVTGTLSPGRDADLIAIKGDPRRNLATLRSVRAVVSRGSEYHPEFTSTRSWNEGVVAPKYQPTA